MIVLRPSPSFADCAEKYRHKKAQNGWLSGYQEIRAQGIRESGEQVNGLTQIEAELFRMSYIVCRESGKLIAKNVKS